MTGSWPPARQMTGPICSFSSRSVPRRTPRERAMRMRGLNDGMRSPDSIRATIPGSRSALSASCSGVMLRDSRTVLTLSPSECFMFRPFSREPAR